MGEKHLGERWLALSRARDIVVWQARRSRSLRSDVYRALGGAGPSAEISTLLGRAAGQCHIMGRSAAESPQLSRGK